MKPLQDCIAIVTGASRGAGRGIAVELGAAGATVYVTGRSTRTQPAQAYSDILALSGMQALPGTIDDTAEEATPNTSESAWNPVDAGANPLLHVSR